MKFYGIDPGKKGGVAKIDDAGALIYAVPMPLQPDKLLDVPALSRLLDFTERSHYALERAQPMPRQGISSTSKYMTDYGRIRGVIESRTPVEFIHLVRPQVWKAILETGRDKQGAIDLVERIYPDFNLILPGRRVRSDGLADSICIALWCRHAHRSV